MSTPEPSKAAGTAAPHAFRSGRQKSVFLGKLFKKKYDTPSPAPIPFRLCSAQQVTDGLAHSLIENQTFFILKMYLDPKTRNTMTQRHGTQ